MGYYGYVVLLLEHQIRLGLLLYRVVILFIEDRKLTHNKEHYRNYRSIYNEESRELDPFSCKFYCNVPFSEFGIGICLRLTELEEEPSE